MAGKQQGQKHEHSGEQKQQEGNLGQKEARQEQEKESELSNMGEMTRETASRRDD